MASEGAVELIDYLNVLWKRKAMIIWMVLLSAASAALVSYLIKPTYEVSRVLKIGQITGMGRIGQAGEISFQERHLIETREAVIETITDQRLLDEVRAKIIPEVPIERFAKQVTVDGKASPQAQASAHVRYTVQAETAVQAVAIADAIADSIIRRHAKIFEEGMAVKQRYQEELKEKIDILAKEIHGMRRTFDEMRANLRVDAAALILLQANLGERERTLAGLKRELRDVQLSNLLLVSENTSQSHSSLKL